MVWWGKAKEGVVKSDHIWGAAFGLSAIMTGGIWWMLPVFPWWVYVLLWIFAAGIWGDQWLKMVANEKIIDRGDWPNKPD